LTDTEKIELAYDVPGGAANVRADARRNRALILDAAEAVFAEQGLGVPVDEIARRAGVGTGTLYRHFPTKEALFEAVVVDHMLSLAGEAAALSDSEHPGDALFDFLGRMVREGSSKRNLIDALTGAGIDFKETAACPKAQMEEAVQKLLTQAQSAGEVRPDVSLPDLIGLVMGACSFAGDHSGCSSERMLAVVCDGLRLPAPSGG
jgi:AcrR family transcriptional regulator